MSRVIDQMYAFIAVDDDGDEGIIARESGLMLLPLVGADMARVNSLKNFVLTDQDCAGRKITLVRFSQREVLQVIDRTHEQKDGEPS